LLKIVGEKKGQVAVCAENIEHIDEQVDAVSQRYKNDKLNLEEEKKALQAEKKNYEEKKVSGDNLRVPWMNS
jgi:hypothetical protein